MSRGLIRAKDIIVDDVLDRIYKAWIGNKIDDLALADRWLLERMEYADAKLREGGQVSRHANLVADMAQKFKYMNDGFTTRTYESDIARAKRFFLVSRPREEKDYALGKSIEWGERLLWKAEKEGDLKAAAAFWKELNAIQKFKTEEIERPDYSAVQPPPIMVVMDPADIGVPSIDNLEEEVMILSRPKGVERNTNNIEDAEVTNEPAE